MVDTAAAPGRPWPAPPPPTRPRSRSLDLSVKIGVPAAVLAIANLSVALYGEEHEWGHSDDHGVHAGWVGPSLLLSMVTAGLGFAAVVVRSKVGSPRGRRHHLGRFLGVVALLASFQTGLTWFLPGDDANWFGAPEIDDYTFAPDDDDLIPPPTALGVPYLDPDGSTITVHAVEPYAQADPEATVTLAPDTNYTLVDAEVCAGTAVTVWRSEFDVESGTGAAPVRAPAFPETRDLEEGDCVRGWISFQVPDATTEGNHGVAAWYGYGSRYGEALWHGDRPDQISASAPVGTAQTTTDGSTVTVHALEVPPALPGPDGTSLVPADVEVCAAAAPTAVRATAFRVVNGTVAMQPAPPLREPAAHDPAFPDVQDLPPGACSRGWVSFRWYGDTVPDVRYYSATDGTLRWESAS